MRIGLDGNVCAQASDAASMTAGNNDHFSFIGLERVGLLFRASMMRMPQKMKRPATRKRACARR